MLNVRKYELLCAKANRPDCENVISKVLSGSQTTKILVIEVSSINISLRMKSYRNHGYTGDHTQSSNNTHI